jgi:hypothetical protein
MRPFVLRFLVLAGCCFLASAGSAQTTHHASVRPAASHAAAKPGPKPIGTFEDWQAATYQESGHTVCYALTRAVSSNPALSGRGQVFMTVTQRPSGRDVVAISAGYAYPANATVSVQAEKAALEFYTAPAAPRSAFARDGHATVQSFGKAGQAVAKGPGPRGAVVTDTFSLRGFDAAYAAINKACPAK